MLIRDIIAIGASAGGIEALSRILPGLSPRLPASIFVVMHIAPHSPGYLATMFSKRGPLLAKTARCWTTRHLAWCCPAG